MKKNFFVVPTPGILTKPAGTHAAAKVGYFCGIALKLQV